MDSKQINWEHDSGVEARDRTPFLWIAIVVLLGAMGVALWAVTRQESRHETRAHVSHILFKYNPRDPADRDRAYAKAQSVREEILNGASFADMARKYSEDEFTRDRGGDMGWIRRGILVESVDRYIWQAPLKQVSPVIDSNYGFHLVWVDDRTLSQIDKYQESVHERVFGNAGREGANGEASP